MTRRLRRILVYAGLLTFCAGWYWTMSKAIDLALVTWMETR